MVVADTVVAIATAPGRGAVGVVRVSGPGATGIMQAITGRGLAPRQATVATFRDASGAAIDHGIALFFPAPSSYTGDDILELQGHGGPAVLRILLNRCLELGARVAEPGEFTRRAFMNDKLDLTQAEAVADLIDASTEQAARAAARSLQGTFSTLVAHLQERLIQLRVTIEASLDFPEEESGALASSDLRIALQEVRSQVEAALQATRYGSLLRDGATVALIGPPNTGKSTIINTLSHESIAIVSPIPGTTRDLVRQSIEIQGIPIHIVDTAGIRQTVDPIEELGIDRSWDAFIKADLAVLVLETGVDAGLFLHGVDARLPSGLPVIVAHNKIDLTGECQRAETIEGREHVWICAKHNAGIEHLSRAIIRICGGSNPGETVFIARTRHTQALQVCAERISTAEQVLTSPELAAEELRLAQAALSQLTGEFVADDLLGQIFAHFCIGK